MGTATVTATLGHDGTIVLPRAVQDELGLREGDEIRITVQRPDSSAEEDDPLLRIIGIGDGRKDGSENHDAYLYGRE